tara:strand:- start:32 stop:322 length:291 start_codon:yes stop_codon:yes gene_type:complete
LDPNNPIHELLLRVEGLIDALEVRGIASEIFFGLCKELEECLKLLPTEEILRKKADDNMRSRFIILVERMKRLENFAGAQSGIMSSLSTYIDNPDK